jgi:transcription elongation GreA/GreB family factor
VRDLDEIPDKRSLHKALQAALERQRELAAASQKRTQDAATHSENRAEGDKDMRATETSYVARGQAQRVQALDEDLVRLAAMPIRGFGEDDPIGLSAIVTMESAAGSSTVFVAAAGGGEKLTVGEQTIAVVTSSAPLGKALIGARVGDEVTVRRGDRDELVEIVAVV